MNRRLPQKLIVFDWNGTLLSDTRASWKAGNECMTFYGAKPISLQHYRETFTFPILHFYKLNGLSVDTVLAKKEESNAIFQSAYETLSARARTRAGTRSLLNWITENQMSSIILSNYRTEKIKEHLKRLKLDPYFQHVSAHDCDGTTILHSTTKSARLSAYMQAHNYNPEDVIIIGDSAEEPEIARALGLTSIGITDGYITTVRLKRAAPDYIVNTLSEIKALITKKWALPH